MEKIRTTIKILFLGVILFIGLNMLFFDSNKVDKNIKKKEKKALIHSSIIENKNVKENKEYKKNEFILKYNKNVPPKEYLEILEKYKDKFSQNLVVSEIGTLPVVFFNVNIEDFMLNQNIYLPNIGDTLAIYTKNNKVIKLIVDNLDYCDSINKDVFAIYGGELNCDFGYYAGRCKFLYQNDSIVLISDTIIDMVFKYKKDNKFNYLSNHELKRKQYKSTDNIEYDFNSMKWKCKNGKSYPINKIEAFRINDEEFFIIEREDDEFLYKEVYKVIEEGKLKLIYEYPQA
ncbi:MAG: hypothetical protein KatS3mg035_2254 [Bacteroidia bacterium]|nr:MAG: hypothetical protein KatS3mg027_2734 [Bacteroidia bacterium]GIV45131.1 MAG: hypothetical protein KatS3mg035_2254 [Bacteroidia bacterium]